MEEEHTYELPNFKEVVASCDVNSQYGIPSNSTSECHDIEFYLYACVICRCLSFYLAMD